jgi:hypothetical protein
MVSAQSNTTAEDRLESAFTSVTSAQRVLLETIADCDRDGVWIEYGAQHYAQWLAARLGISQWAARRWITAANALSRLPRSP